MGLVCVPLREKKPIMKKFTFISRKFHSIIVRTGNACLSTLPEGEMRKKREKKVNSDIKKLSADVKLTIEEHAM